MISVMQIFKIIFGIVLSVFILMIILRFSSSYWEIGESGKEVEILMGMKKTIEDVHTTGISMDFDMGSEDLIYLYSPPDLVTSVMDVNIDPVTLLLVPGKTISIHREEYDIGWWRFRFVYALPETRILFAPLDTAESRSDLVWNSVGNITRYLPSTENTETKVRFGVGCNDTGDRQTYFFLDWEGDYFIRTVLTYLLLEGYEFVPCRGMEGYRIVTVSETPVDAGFQVVPFDSEIGYVYVNYMNESPGSYLYKNPLDIISVLLGGEKFYDYLNGKFLKELSVASSLASREANLLRTKSNRQECDPIHSRFVQILGSLRNGIDEWDYRDEDDMRELSLRIRQSSETYEELEEMGC